MTQQPTGGELNPTQDLYARTLGRQRWDMLEHHVRRRMNSEPAFKARVFTTTRQLVGSFPYGLVRASEEFLATVLHVDDVVSGRWQASEHETDPLAKIGSGAGFLHLDNMEIFEVSLMEHRKGSNCVDLGPEHPVCPGCGMGWANIQTKP